MKVSWWLKNKLKTILFEFEDIGVSISESDKSKLLKLFGMLDYTESSNQKAEALNSR
jgi:hypothetical protein